MYLRDDDGPSRPYTHTHDLTLESHVTLACVVFPSPPTVLEVSSWLIVTVLSTRQIEEGNVK
jgi:hypothetical protein